MFPARLGRLRLLWVLLLTPSVLFAGLAMGVYEWAHIDTPERLGQEARAEVIEHLRAALRGAPRGERSHSKLRRHLDGGGPVIVTGWLHGRERFRVAAKGNTVDSAIDAAAAQVAEAAQKLGNARELVRLKVDIVVGRGPLLEIHPLVRAVALHPGIDGIGVRLRDGSSNYLLPDDLINANLLMAGAPIKHVDFKVGLSYERALRLLARRSRQSPADLEKQRISWFRFRTDSFIEAPAGTSEASMALTRGQPARPELSAARLREASLRGGRYLVAQIADNGRYIYQTDLHSGHRSNPKARGPYSIPRHAGTTYFLAELYRKTKSEFLRTPIELAFGHLQELIEGGGCAGTLESGAEFACVVDLGQRVTDLGSTALTVVALAEYQRATGSSTYLPLARRLSEWILWMQREDGSFTHQYQVQERMKDEDAYLLYYSGEAALALARMHTITGEKRYIEAAERGLDNLVGFYDFFLGGFFYGEEHWTCIAAEAAYPAIKKEEYWEFCDGYGEFLRAQQLQPGDFPSQEDLAGSYIFTPFAMPQNTPTGSRTESMISTYLLGSYYGHEQAELRQQIMDAMAYSLGQQVRPGFDWFVPPTLVGDGAIPTTPVDRSVRIDYVQHVCSAMIRAAELFESP